MRFLKLLLLNLAATVACTSFYPTGCIFDPLIVMNPTTGAVITDETCGSEIDKQAFREQPYVFYSGALNDRKYTLIMVDNESPLADYGNSYLHWLITDIDGLTMKYGLGISSGRTVAAYAPPDPPQDSCIHRYSIFVYEQNHDTMYLPALPDLRSQFNLLDFIESVNAEGGACEPVASIEFKSRF